MAQQSSRRASNENKKQKRYQPDMTGPGAPRSRLTPAQKRVRLQREREQAERRQRRRMTCLGVLLLIVVTISTLVIMLVNGSFGAKNEGLDELDAGSMDEEAEEALYEGPPVANFAFVGDISTSAAQVAAVTKNDGTFDFAAVFEDVSDYLTDYTVGSFETTIVDGMAYGGEPYYNSPVQLAGTLRGLGFRLMSTANTYALNNGIDGLTSTRNYLTEAKLKSVGTYLSQEERDKNGGAYIRSIHKIKFAFLSYTKGTDSVTMPEGCEYALNTLYSDYSDYWTDLRRSQIRQDVQAARDAGAEVIIALVHWGSEYGRTVQETQQEAAELLMQSGVDVIIGTHSHVVGEMGFQEVELTDGTKKNCFVAYSLGDFYTDPEQPEAQQSLILNLEFARGEDGRVSLTAANYIPIYMHITEDGGKRQFAVLDVYKELAELKRSNMTADQAELYNALLETVETLHTYAGEELDRGPVDSDSRMVENALSEGEISAAEIKALRKAEQAAQAEDGEPAESFQAEGSREEEIDGE